jgi:hypothetical protein
MLKRNKWIIPLLLLSLLASSCGLLKTRIVTKTDSIFIDKTKLVTTRIVDTIITIKSDTLKFSFKQPQRDTTFSLTNKDGVNVLITLKNKYYYLSSISLPKQIPIKITEKVVEYRNVYVREKSKVVTKKSNYKQIAIVTLLIISILVIIFIFKQKIINYATQTTFK